MFCKNKSSNIHITYNKADEYLETVPQYVIDELYKISDEKAFDHYGMFVAPLAVAQVFLLINSLFN